MKNLNLIVCRFLISFIVLLSSAACYGASNTEKLARKGIDQVINLQIDDARKTFARLQKVSPDYPFLPFLIATADWAEAEKTNGGGRDQLRNKAIQSMEAAVLRADKEIIRQGTDVDGWRMTRGMAKFFAARMYADSGKTLKTYRLAIAGRDELRELVEKNPDANDAYLVLGMYEYIAGSIPRGLRWLATLFDLRGDRDKGVRYLERASAHATVMAPEAARMLLVAAGIQPETTRKCAYLPMAEHARKKYPANPHYSLALQLLYVNCGYPGKALLETAVSERQFLKEFPNLAGEFEVIRIYAYRDQGNVEKILSLKNEFKRDTSYWKLILAQTYDVVGQSKKAKSIYDEIYWADLEDEEIQTDSGPPVDWIVERATKHRKNPYQASDSNAKIVGDYLYLDNKKPKIKSARK